MEEFLQQTLLYDFYGELLTEHQRKVYEEVVLNDLSYSEAAEMFGVSRQGVHELVKRCNKILSEYESKLHLVERFVQIRETVKQIQKMASQIDFIDKETLASGVRELSGKILEEL
ncbi:MAG: sigma factor-like helix-turn-helix DNA-binding protein [Lachnospiraceae bacterium]|nr:sigma factor-like helix-turn-helix DNA-binding protein [Lachnospiraceae bacterium]